MNVDLAGQARSLVAALPASVTLPAGTGKTHLLAAVVKELSAPAEGIRTAGNRVLVLTHTNAGVQAIRRRLAEFGAGKAVRVNTITSFAFELAKAYPRLGGLEIPRMPNWDNSGAYVAAAIQVSQSPHIRQVLRASFTHLLVDEYQDCSEPQHEFVLCLTDAIPATGVFGDPLQAIFGFADPLVSWPTVEAIFPAFNIEWTPWRWRGHNEALGEWLLYVRRLLKADAVLDLTPGELPPGVSFRRRSSDGRELAQVARQVGTTTETVLALCGAARQMVRSVASTLNGQYTAMEEIQGSYMRKQLITLDATNPSRYSRWLANVAKDCFVGYAPLDRTVLAKLDRGQPVSQLRRPGLTATLATFDQVTTNPSLGSLARAMADLARAGEAKLHSHEAWYDMAAAIRGTASAYQANQQNSRPACRASGAVGYGA